MSDDELIAALKRAEANAHFHAGVTANPNELEAWEADADIIRTHIADLQAGGDRAKVVAIVKQYRDGADRYHADTGGGYCCLKTAANILEAIASGAHMETNNAD